MASRRTIAGLLPLIVAILAVSTLTACQSSGSGPADEVSRRAAPYNLNVETDYGELTASWQVRDQHLYAGYNIYILPLGTSTPEPFNTSIYPGDADKDDTVIFETGDVETGIRYEVYVRIVYSDQSESIPSEIDTVTVAARGEVILPIRNQAPNDGYSFVEDRAVRARDDANDLYYFSRDGQDYLCSPTRLDGFLRNSQLYLLGQLPSLDAAAQALADLDNAGGADRIAVSTGDWVAARLHDGTSCLLRVEEFRGDGTERTVRLRFVHSGVAGPVLL